MKSLTISVMTIATRLRWAVATFAGLAAGMALAVGPVTSDKFNEETGAANLELPEVTTQTKLSLVIPVLDPVTRDLPRPYHQDEKRGEIFEEIRRAEANLLAVSLRDNFHKTGYFDKVRVTPTDQAIGELYLLGRIMRSNGEQLHLEITVTDISQFQWVQPKIYKLTVDERDITESARLRNTDPYQPLINEIVLDVVNVLAKRSETELLELKGIADMTFAASYSVETFGKYLGSEKKKIRVKGKRKTITATKLNGRPDNGDMQYQRILNVRAKEELFLDDLQPRYDEFAGRTTPAYIDWQDDAHPIAVEARKTRGGRNAKIAGAAALAILGAAAADTGGNEEAATAALAGAAALSYSAFRTSKRYAAISDSLSELGDSVNIQLARGNIEFEGQTTEFEGNAAEQYQKVRNFLHKVYAEEATPDVQLSVEVQ